MPLEVIVNTSIVDSFHDEETGKVHNREATTIYIQGTLRGVNLNIKVGEQVEHDGEHQARLAFLQDFAAGLIDHLDHV